MIFNVILHIYILRKKYLYDNHEVEVPSDSNEIIKNIGCLKNNFLSREEVEKRVKFLCYLYLTPRHIFL